MPGYEVEQILRDGGIGVLPTDTIYGLVGSALSKKAVTRIYRLKKRDPKKPFIVLIGDLKDLKLFGIGVDLEILKKLKKFSSEGESSSGGWPEKVSVVLPCPGRKFSYLHRGTKTLAFRLPAESWLRKLLRETGPLVAPSANPEGLPPAVRIAEARKYFGDEADFYIDGGRLAGKPSKLILLRNGKVVILRK